MAQKVFYVDALAYQNRMRGVLSNFRVGERLVIPDARKDNPMEVFYFGGFRTTLVYGGNNSVLIAGAPKSIEKTKSRLESITGVKLTELIARR